MRDESHRYAITSHRSARSKNFRRSKLEEIPGVGKAKAALLITKFGSTRAIMDTAEADLAGTSGIGTTLARRIQDYLRQADEGSSKN